MPTKSKGHISMRQIYEDCAAVVADDPTHCDVRCACNDIMDGYEREGFTVHHGYSQDLAFTMVCRLKGGRHD